MLYESENNYIEEKPFWNLLAGLCLPHKKRKGVLTYFESPRALFESSTEEKEEFLSLASILEFTDAEKKRILEFSTRDPVREMERMKTKDMEFILSFEEGFPKQLKACYDCPDFLYYRGSLPVQEMPMISIIGARAASPYGLETARVLAQNLSAEGIGIVSGLAHGVDRAAHEGALAQKEKTYAILGYGVDQCYPKENYRAYEAIPEYGGALISEYPPGTPPLSCFFPLRNRIIAGLSEGIAVTEARKKSGSLITVAIGLEYGKNIYALPGRVTDILSEGCNYLIREGAKPILSSKDILEDFKGRIRSEQTSKKRKKCENMKKNKNSLATNEKIVYASLRLSQKHIEDILAETRLPPSEVAAILESLVQRGCIKRYGQAYYGLSGEG